MPPRPWQRLPRAIPNLSHTKRICLLKNGNKKRAPHFLQNIPWRSGHLALCPSGTRSTSFSAWDTEGEGSLGRLTWTKQRKKTTRCIHRQCGTSSSIIFPSEVEETSWNKNDHLILFRAFASSTYKRHAQIIGFDPFVSLKKLQVFRWGGSQIFRSKTTTWVCPNQSVYTEIPIKIIWKPCIWKL